MSEHKSHFHTQATQNKVSDTVRNENDEFVAAIINLVVDTVSTAIHSVVIKWIEKAGKSITVSSRHVLYCLVQKFDQRDFSENSVDTLLMTASACTKWFINISRSDETWEIEAFEDWEISGIEIRVSLQPVHLAHLHYQNKIDVKTVSFHILATWRWRGSFG